MEIEVLEENVKYTAPVIECCLCKKTGEGLQWTYAMLKNTFYCSECWKVIPNINNALDKRFSEVEKRVEDLIKGAVEKNKKLRKLEEGAEDKENRIKKLEEAFDKIIERMLNEFIKNSEELEEKNI